MNERGLILLRTFVAVLRLFLATALFSFLLHFFFCSARLNGIFMAFEMDTWCAQCDAIYHWNGGRGQRWSEGWRCATGVCMCVSWPRGANIYTTSLSIPSRSVNDGRVYENTFPHQTPSAIGVVCSGGTRPYNRSAVLCKARTMGEVWLVANAEQRGNRRAQMCNAE